MNRFQYVAARTIQEAVEALATSPGPARPLAGGTDLIVQLNEGRRQLARVVDIGRIPALHRIERDDDGATFLGSVAPCASVYSHIGIRQDYPILVDSASLIGSVQIQSRASIGGNLCNAAPSADGVPALICLDGVAVVAGPNGEREVAVDAFCTGPGTTVLQQGEILVGVRLRAPAKDEGGAYLRFIPRNEMDIAVAGAGAWVRVNPDTRVIEDARIALSAVAPTPLRVRDAEAALIGKTATRAALADAADIASGACRPISDVRGSAEYRRHLVSVLVRRSLARALSRAGVPVDDAAKGGVASGQ